MREGSLRGFLQLPSQSGEQLCEARLALSPSPPWSRRPSTSKLDLKLLPLPPQLGHKLSLVGKIEGDLTRRRKTWVGDRVQSRHHPHACNLETSNRCWSFLLSIDAVMMTRYFGRVSLESTAENSSNVYIAQMRNRGGYQASPGLQDMFLDKNYPQLYFSN